MADELKRIDINEYIISTKEKILNVADEMDDNGLTRTIVMAMVDAVEKQIPKKPNNKCTPVGNYVVGQCPVCGEFSDTDAKFCYECGQALDWTEEGAD